MKPVTRARSSGRLPIRLRGRSHTALVLAPEPPIAAWLADLDALLQRCPAAFIGRLALLNVSALSLSGPELAALVNDLRDRDVRLVGIEGADSTLLSPGLPPPLTGGSPTSIIEFGAEMPLDTKLCEPAPV